MEVLEQAPASSSPARHAPVLSDHLLRRVQREFTFRWDTLWGGRSLPHGRNAGPDAVRLNGNDYLNLTGHPVKVHVRAAGSAGFTTLLSEGCAGDAQRGFALEAHGFFVGKR